MKSFDVSHMTPTEFVASIRDELAERDYARYLALELDGARLNIELRWMGTTRFEYRVEPVGEGFRAELRTQKISPFHVVFADRFDEYFAKALAKVGAKAG